MSIKPLTKKELKGYFQVYREAFPDWEVKHGVVLVRSCDLIAQHIDFQILRYGAYRPQCCIWVAGPMGQGWQLLPQMLDVKHRQVERRQHATGWPKVLKAIEQQFVPNVRKPLDVAEVLQIADDDAERRGITNQQYLNGLAVLNTYLGHDERAIKWCNRAEMSFTEFIKATSPADWMLKQKDFTHQLREAIQGGQGKEFLIAVSDQQSP